MAWGETAMAADEETVEALRARLGRTVESLLVAGGSAPVTRLPVGAGRPAATSRRGPVSDERLLRALVKEISRLIAEEGRRGVQSG